MSFTFLVTVCLMFSLSWKLSLIVFLILPALVCVSVYFGRVPDGISPNSEEVASVATCGLAQLEQDVRRKPGEPAVVVHLRVVRDHLLPVAVRRQAGRVSRPRGRAPDQGVPKQ